MVKEVLRQAEEKMKRTIEAFRKELTTIRAGRAVPALVERITAEYYGTPTPINQMANISTPDPRTLVIQPWDKASLKAIEKGILASDLGVTPSNDGQIIRLNFPPLTEERRRDLVKSLNKRAEEERVFIRNHRRDANDAIKKLEKEKKISEDEAKRGQDEIQKLTDRCIKELDQVLEAKEKEVMEV